MNQNHKQEASGYGNKIIHFNPGSYSRTETTNNYSRDDMLTFMREKLKMWGLATIIILQVLILLIIVIEVTRQADLMDDMNMIIRYINSN